MSFTRLHKLVTYLITGLGLYALTLGGELDLLVAVLLGVAAVGSFFVEGEILARPSWIRGWNAAVLGVLFLELARAALGGALLGLGLEFAAFLQVSRLFNRRSARDYQQIAVLAFLHLIAATVLSTELAYGVAFVGFVIVTPWMLVLSHLRREIEDNYERESSRGPGVARILASKRIVGPGLLVGTALLTVPIFVLTIGLFLAFPRVGLGALSFGLDSGTRTAGFGRNVELGDFGVIRDDPTVVLRVRIPSLARPPSTLGLRMRGTSFDHYDGRAWTRALAQGETLRSFDAHYVIERVARPGDLRMEIVLDHLDEPVVFLPEGTVALDVPPRVENGIDTERGLSLSPGLDLRYEDDDGLGLAYTAHVTDDLETTRIEAPTPDELASYTSLPPDVERIAALARRITRGARDDAQRAQLVETYLRDSGRYGYTLDLPRIGAEAPLDAFLFRTRRGHCEYFSSAMAILLRTLGIPTRNVTGLVGGTFNQYGGYYALRQGDAHSWLEAWVDGRWRTYDPTPPARDAVVVDDGLLAEVRAMFDAVRTRWEQDVVSYDLRAQVDGLRRAFQLYQRLRREWWSDPAAAADPADEPERTAREGRAGPFVGIAIAVVVAALVAWAIRARRRRSRTRGSDPAQRAATRLYRELERALAARGRPRPESATPREHARALEQEGFAGATEVSEVTVRYDAARWGRLPLEAHEIRSIREKIQRIAAG